MGAGVVLQGLRQQSVACARIATGRGHLNQQAAGTELNHGVVKLSKQLWRAAASGLLPETD